jgi:hypothetical protein
MKQIISLLPDALMICGAATASYGAWLIYEPAGYIALGIALIACGVLIARGEGK